MTRTTIAAAILLIAAAAMALPPEGPLPPGKWWDRTEVVQRLGLTSEQRGQLDKIFQGSANELIDLRGEVEKRSIALRGLMDQDQLNRGSIQSAAGKLSEARSRLFERELMMFVDMRAVLTADQWTQFRDELATRRPRDGRGRQGGGGPNKPPRP